MSEKGLIGLTLGVWFSFLAVSVAFIIATNEPFNADTDPFIAMTIVILAIITMITTRTIWNSNMKTVSNIGHQKSKREHKRLENLMNLMNDDDIVELESMLQAREYNNLRLNGN